MRHLHSEFHFRHALFALQSPDGYVDALLESARRQVAPSRPARPSPDERVTEVRDPQMSMFRAKSAAPVGYRHH